MADRLIRYTWRALATAPDDIFHLVYFGYEPTVVDSQVLVPAELLGRDGVTVRIVLFESPGEWLRPWRIAAKRRKVAARGLDAIFLPRVPRNLFGLNSRLLSLRLGSALRRSARPVIHARGFQGAAIALSLKPSVPSLRVVCDARGIEAEEYIYDARKRTGRPPGAAQRWWKRRLEDLERTAVRSSDVVLTVSRAMKPFLEERAGVSLEGRWSHVPCAVLTRHFSEGRTRRDEIRRALKIESRTVLVYSGTLSAWQIPALLPEVFQAFRRVDPACFFLGLTPDVAALQSLFSRRGFGREDVHVCSVPHPDVPGYLAAGDIGLLLREEHLLNRYACPTKFAEYLAAGLYVLATPAVQEVADVLGEEEAGTLVPGVDRESLSAAARITLENLRAGGAVKRSLRAARRFDWASFVPVLKKWYLSAPQ